MSLSKCFADEQSAARTTADFKWHMNFSLTMTKSYVRNVLSAKISFKEGSFHLTYQCFVFHPFRIMQLTTNLLSVWQTVTDLKMTAGTTVVNLSQAYSKSAAVTELLIHELPRTIIIIITITIIIIDRFSPNSNKPKLKLNALYIITRGITDINYFNSYT